MKISKLIIPDFQQFKNFELDLTYPEGHPRAGEPLDKVCFIGRNGTGKSTLLRLINASLRSMSDRLVLKSNEIILKVEKNNNSFYFISIDSKINPEMFYFKPEIKNESNWIEGLNKEKNLRNK